MSNSDIQKNLTEVIELIQQRNSLEGEYSKLLLTSQEILTQTNEILKENLILQGKDISEYENAAARRKKTLEEEKGIRKEINKLNEDRNDSENISIANSQAINQSLSQQANLFQKIKISSTFTGAALGAASGLATGITTIFRIGKIAVQGFLDVLSKVTSTVFGVAKSIFMLPFNMFKSFVSMASSMSGSTELLDAIEGIRKEWGSFSNAMAGDVLKASSLGINLKNGAVAHAQFWSQSLAPGRSMMRVWSSLAAMVKEVGATFNALGSTVNLVMDQFKEADGTFGNTLKSIVAMKKGLGLTDEEFKGFAEHTFSNGKKIEDSMYEIGNLSLQLGDKFGISSKKISSDVGKMMKDLGNFGNLTEKQITSAATHFQRLGIEVGKVTGLMDKFDQFEDAAEGASKLSQAFGLQIDSMELMRAEDPAERQQILANAMMRAGRSTDGMSRSTLKLLSSTVGLDAATTKMMFSSQNLEKSYDEVKDAADEASKKQLTQEEVLTRLADAIEKVNRAGGGMKDGFLKTFLDGIQKGIERTPSFMNMMQNLRAGLRQTWFAGMGTGQSIFSMLGITDEFDMKTGKVINQGIFGKIGESFGADAMAKFWGGLGKADKNGKRQIVTTNSVSGFLKSMFDPKSSVEQINESFDNIQKLFKDKFNELTDPNNKSLYGKLQKLGEVLGNIFKRIFEGIGTKIGDMFKKGAVLLKGSDIQDSVSKAAEDAANSPWGKFITPVWEGIKGAFASAFEGFATFAPELLKKIIAGLTWIFKGVQYFLADDKTRKELDKGTKGSFLGMAPSKPGTKQDNFSESINKSYETLSKGVGAVFDDKQLMNSFHSALEGAFTGIKGFLISMFKDILHEAWEQLKGPIGELIIGSILSKATMGAIQGAVKETFLAQKAVGSAGEAAKAAELAGETAKATQLAGEAAETGGILAKLGSKIGSIGGGKLGALSKSLGKFAAPLAAISGAWQGWNDKENGGITGAIQGILTGNAKSGSMFSEWGLTKKGSGWDIAASLGGAAMQGGTVGAGAGALAGGIGAVPGMVIGAGLGVGTELYKMFRDRNKNENIESQSNAVSPQTGTSQQLTNVANTNAQTTQAVKETTEAVQITKQTSEDLKQNMAVWDKNIKTMSDTSSTMTINTDKVVVELKNNYGALMEGINSIKTSTRNVNVQVAVAVELNVKDLEKAIISQESSIIKKAVKLLEGNFKENNLKISDVADTKIEGPQGKIIPKATL